MKSTVDVKGTISGGCAGRVCCYLKHRQQRFQNRFSFSFIEFLS